jgi:hypothetical protein
MNNAYEDSELFAWGRSKAKYLSRLELTEIESKKKDPQSIFMRSFRNAVPIHRRVANKFPDDLRENSDEENSNI